MTREKLRQLLLLDGIGALVSAIMLGGVLVYFQVHVGMPSRILYALAIAASCFALFSMSSYYSKSVNPQNALRTIGVINIIYCLVSVSLVIYYYSILTLTGIIYFALEKIIVLSLAFIELKASKK